MEWRLSPPQGTWVHIPSVQSSRGGSRRQQRRVCLSPQNPSPQQGTLPLPTRASSPKTLQMCHLRDEETGGVIRAQLGRQGGYGPRCSSAQAVAWSPRWAADVAGEVGTGPDESCPKQLQGSVAALHPKPKPRIRRVLGYTVP